MTMCTNTVIWKASYFYWNTFLLAFGKENSAIHTGPYNILPQKYPQLLFSEQKISSLPLSICYKMIAKWQVCYDIIEKKQHGVIYTLISDHQSTKLVLFGWWCARCMVSFERHPYLPLQSSIFPCLNSLQRKYTHWIHWREVKYMYAYYFCYIVNYI